MSKSTDLNSMGLKATFPRLKILELFESGKAVFEIKAGTHHDHLVCINCGRVEEFFDEEIERRQKKIAKERGFAIQEHALYLYAECTKVACQHRDTREKSRHQ